MHFDLERFSQREKLFKMIRKKIGLGTKFKILAKNYFLATPFFGRRRKFESPISRLRKVVEGFLKKQNV